MIGCIVCVFVNVHVRTSQHVGLCNVLVQKCILPYVYNVDTGMHVRRYVCMPVLPMGLQQLMLLGSRYM